MRIARYPALLICIVLLFACRQEKSSLDGENTQADSGRSPVEVTAHTDRTTATLADDITFTLTVCYENELHVRFPEIGSQIAGLRIVDFGEEGPREVDNRQEFKKWYRLRSDITGAFIIPSMAVTYTDTDTSEKEIKTPQIFIEIKSAINAEDGEALQDILDIKPLQEVKRDLTPYIIGGSACIVLITIAIGILLYINKRTKRAQEPPKPAHVLAFEELEKLQKEHLIEKGGVREHYFRLSDIFRRYIENRFYIPAVEQTTQELLPELTNRRDIDDATKKTSRDFLVHSDLIKFAKHKPSGEEIDGSYQHVVKVINTTKEEPEVEKKGEPRLQQTSPKNNTRSL